MKKILIAIPTNKYIEPETFKSIYDLTVPPGYITEFQFFYGYQIDQIRNLIADWAKRYDYLFSVDSDIVLPKDALVKMIAADVDIISGLYIQRIPGTQTVEIYGVDSSGGISNIPYGLLENRGIVEVVACGFGCCLIKGDVFRKMPYPHFVYKSALSHRDTVSEDVNFCTKARSMGFRVWADTSIKCDHIGSYKFTLTSPLEKHLEEIFMQDLLPKTSVDYIKKLDADPKVIYDIGSAVLHWTRHATARWPDAKIFLLEESKDTEFLYRRFNFDYHHALLTDSDNKSVTFYKDPYNIGGNSYYKETTGHYNNTHAVKSIGMTLDTVVKQRGWPAPDLIKIDVQGAEIDVLKGASETIKNCKDIILEAQHVDYNSGAPKVKEVINFLETLGYELVANFSKNSVDGDYHFRKKS